MLISQTGMVGFLAHRLLTMIPLLLGITFISFLVVGLAPGDFFDSLAMNPAISPQAIEAMKADFGYGDPLLVRYGKWLWQVLQGDLGVSLAHRVSVMTLIAQRAGNTLILSLAAAVFTWTLAIPLGVLIAVRRGQLSDRLFSIVGFLGLAQRLVSGRWHFFAGL